MIEHGDNFTEEDIEFVENLHGQIIGGNSDLYHSYTLAEVISNAQRGEHLFWAYFENPYVICGYKKLNQPKPPKDNEGNIRFDATQYVWYKFYEAESIPEMIEDMKISSYSYLLYDCTIKRDISSNVEYNKTCKYFLKYAYGSDFDAYASDMIIYCGRTDITKYDNKFIPSYKVTKNAYEVYIDENGAEYLFFKHKRYLSDGSLEYDYAEDFFASYNGDFYDIVSPYLEVLKEIIDIDGDLIQYSGIRLDILMQLEINESGD